MQHDILSRSTRSLITHSQEKKIKRIIKSSKQNHIRKRSKSLHHDYEQIEASTARYTVVWSRIFSFSLRNWKTFSSIAWQCGRKREIKKDFNWRWITSLCQYGISISYKIIFNASHGTNVKSIEDQRYKETAVSLQVIWGLTPLPNLIFWPYTNHLQMGKVSESPTEQNTPVFTVCYSYSAFPSHRSLKSFQNKHTEKSSV